ncbi:MAG: VWA domain-containing protein [Actinomycetota bacterium]
MLEFTGALRDAGVPVSVGEDLDALSALSYVSLADKRAVHSALAATMVKTDAHRDAFDLLFELYFGTGRGDAAVDAGDELAEQRSADDVAAAVGEAIAGGVGQAIRELAREAVARFGRVDSPSGQWWSNYEVARTLDLNSLLARLERSAGDSETAGWQQQVARQQVRSGMDAFRAAVLAETRRRVAEHRGAAAVASYAVAPLPEDLSFLSATTDLEEVRRAVRPLARKLAARIAMKRKRSTRGTLDMRRTFRRSLSTGGVFVDTPLRRKVPHRPEIVILCDVSGSVARFSRFALLLTHALNAQFTRVRSFAFVDAIDEVTTYFDNEDFAEAIRAMGEQAIVVRDDGRSDYGAIFEMFVEEHATDIGPKTTLLILGDARNNYRARGTEALKELSTRARHTYWLNPEPRGDWDTGDSVASDYAEYVDEMVEVRNLRQLETFIATEL